MDQLCGWKILYYRWYILKSWWSFYCVFAEIFNILDQCFDDFICGDLLSRKYFFGYLIVFCRWPACLKN